MSLDAGRLRHLVTIEDQTTTIDSSGQNTDWTYVARAWAAIEPVSGREFIAAQAENSAVTTRILIRFRDDVRASMRIRHGGKVYNIRGVLPDKESGREYLTLMCEQGANEG